MAASGEFPKSDGDILYATEVNQFASQVNHSYTGSYSTHTESLAIMGSILVGSEFAGTRGAFLGYKAEAVANTCGLQLHQNDLKINNTCRDNFAEINNYLYIGNNTKYYEYTPLSLGSGDVIKFYGDCGANGSVFVYDMHIYCPDPTVKFENSVQ